MVAGGLNIMLTYEVFTYNVNLFQNKGFPKDLRNTQLWVTSSRGHNYGSICIILWVK